MAEEFQTWEVTEPYLDLKCSLGEGPHYEPATNHFRFVDIIEKRIHTVDLTAGPESLKTLQLDIPVGVTSDIEGIDPTKSILVGGKSGIYILERETGERTLLKKFYETEENDERLRSNDGAIDPAGRFWLGTMNDFWVGPPQAEGSLFRFSSDSTQKDIDRKTIRTSLVIPNSIGWSPDNKTLYFTHTTDNQILAFDFDVSTGDLSNERVFYQHEGPGSPDGFRVDVEGNIWHAFYGGSCVLKISPEGKVVGKVTFPAKAITCTQFVGTELWATSAKDGETEFGGGLFRVDVGVKGLEPFKFKLGKEWKL